MRVTTNLGNYILFDPINEIVFPKKPYSMFPRPCRGGESIARGQIVYNYPNLIFFKSLRAVSWWIFASFSHAKFGEMEIIL